MDASGSGADQVIPKELELALAKLQEMCRQESKELSAIENQIEVVARQYRLNEKFLGVKKMKLMQMQTKIGEYRVKLAANACRLEELNARKRELLDKQAQIDGSFFAAQKAELEKEAQKLTEKAEQYRQQSETVYDDMSEELKAAQDVLDAALYTITKRKRVQESDLKQAKDKTAQMEKVKAATEKRVAELKQLMYDLQFAEKLH